MGRASCTDGRVHCNVEANGREMGGGPADITSAG
jgi:hypothetical protein